MTIGVPVYQGQKFLNEALESIQASRFKDFEVLISIDGPDPECEAICQVFLNDQRFRLYVQPERLGWLDNINWLMSQANHEFWYFHQQDDLVDPSYLETLVHHLDSHPEAALAYTDITVFGNRRTERWLAESVVGSPFARQMSLLNHYFPAFAFRGLTRQTAVATAGGIPQNLKVEGFGSDTAWLAAIALSGELQRVALPLYRKRYHERNFSDHWFTWPMELKLPAWALHCVRMAEQALRLELHPQEARLLWFAAIARLTSPSIAGHYLPVGELSDNQRLDLLNAFLEEARESTLDICYQLDADWAALSAWSRLSYWLPNHAPLEISAYGPDSLKVGQRFNPQPDGRSAFWVRANRRIPPGSVLELDGQVLETSLEGSLATATSPIPVFDQPGTSFLMLRGLGNIPISAKLSISVHT